MVQDGNGLPVVVGRLCPPLKRGIKGDLSHHDQIQSQAEREGPVPARSNDRRRTCAVGTFAPEAGRGDEGDISGGVGVAGGNSLLTLLLQSGGGGLDRRQPPLAHQSRHS